MNINDQTANSGDDGFVLKVEAGTLPTLSTRVSADDGLRIKRHEYSYKDPFSSNRQFNSRYLENFEEIELLGKGASGEVIKVK